MGNQLRNCIPAALLMLLPLCGSEPDPNGPVIRNVVQDFSKGTVDFDMVNAGTQDVSAWRVGMTSYDSDGKIAGAYYESRVVLDVSNEVLKPGASKHFAWALTKLEGGVWPAKISVDVSAYLLADNTAYGDEAGIQEFVRDLNTELRVARHVVELLEAVKASADPLGTIKQQLQKLPPDEAVPVPERAFRYMLNKSAEILQGAHPEALQKLLDDMRERVARAQRNAQIKIVEN